MPQIAREEADQVSSIRGDRAMQLSRTVEYALHATLQLARGAAGGPISSSKLAAVGVMPERFLLQVLRQMVTHGLLRSTRGVDGGYALARDPNEITLLDVIEAVEGPLVFKPPSAQTLPEPTWTGLRVTLDNGVAALRAEYARLTLAQIVKDSAAEQAASAAAPPVDSSPAPVSSVSAKTRRDGPANSIVSHTDPSLDRANRASI